MILTILPFIIILSKGLRKCVNPLCRGDLLPSSYLHLIESEAEVATSVFSMSMSSPSLHCLVLLLTSRLSSWRGAEHRDSVQACEVGGPEPCGFHTGHFLSQSPWHCDLADEALGQVKTQFVHRNPVALLKPLIYPCAPLKWEVLRPHSQPLKSFSFGRPASYPMLSSSEG